MKYLSKEAFDAENVFGLGLENTAYAQYFIGNSYLNPLTKPEDGLHLSNVTFEPGCRNNWHIHHATSGGGQLLICTAGEGWYQEEGKPAVSLEPGKVIVIPANVRHWHGAKGGQLVLAYCDGSSGNRKQHGMVRTGNGRGISAAGLKSREIGESRLEKGGFFDRLSRSTSASFFIMNIE